MSVKCSSVCQMCVQYVSSMLSVSSVASDCQVCVKSVSSVSSVCQVCNKWVSSVVKFV